MRAGWAPYLTALTFPAGFAELGVCAVELFWGPIWHNM